MNFFNEPFCSTQRPEIVLTPPVADESQLQSETHDNYSLFSTSDFISITKPISILLYPDKTVTLFEGQEVENTQRPCTQKKERNETQIAAQKLRDMG